MSPLSFFRSLARRFVLRVHLADFLYHLFFGFIVLLPFVVFLFTLLLVIVSFLFIVSVSYYSPLVYGLFSFSLCRCCVSLSLLSSFASLISCRPPSVVCLSLTLLLPIGTILLLSILYFLSALSNSVSWSVRPPFPTL